MCSANAPLDPGNFFGKREGGMNMMGIINPGGSIVKNIHGKSDPLQKQLEKSTLDSEAQYGREKAVIDTYGTSAAERRDKKGIKPVFGAPKTNEIGTIL